MTRHAPADAPLSGSAAGPPAAQVDIAGVTLGGARILGPLVLSVNSGETLVLTGPSGVGKSTLLRTVAGMIAHDGGRITVPSRVAMVFQEPLLLPWRRALENITLTTGADAARARSALADVGLADKATFYPAQLSLGQQRRLSLARAFATDPDLLLMDEPFVSLDPDLADEMMALFQRLQRAHATATLMVTHSPDEAARLADRVLRLDGQPARIV